jgi:tetratricopeptide (TPR) repeat protein
MRIHRVRHPRFPIVILVGLAAVSLFAQITLIEQGRAAIARGDSGAAIDVLEKAVAQSPKSAEAHYYLGSAYGIEVQASGMFGAAKYASRITEEFEKAVALDPRHVEARFGLVQVYSGAPGLLGGSYEKAFDQAKAIKAIDPIVGHRAYAFIYAQQKKLDLAEKEYADAIREEPDSAKAHSYFGQYRASVEKNYPAAFSELEAALKADPSYMPAWYHLGRAASLANTNLARGEEALRKYVAYTPKQNEPTLASAHYFLGDIYEKQGRKAEAKQAYQAALKLNPTLTRASEALKRVS